MFDVGFPVKVAAICADEIAEWQRTTHALREYVAELTERLRGYEHERSVFNFSDQVTSQRHLGSDEAWCTSECRKVCEKSVSSAAAPALAPTPSSAPSILEVERLLTTACDDTCFGYTCDTWSSSYTCDEMESTYACDCSGCECEMCDDTNNGATDPYSDGCQAYSIYPSWCGSYDDSDFSSEQMCCACDGGLTPSATPTVSDGPTFSPAPTVSGFDVLTHDELSDAVDNAPDNGRQWAITIVTNVIAVESALFLRNGINIKIMGDNALGQRARIRPTNNYDGFLSGWVSHTHHAVSASLSSLSLIRRHAV